MTTVESLLAMLDAVRARMSFASVHGLDCDTPMPTATVTLAEIDAMRASATASAARITELETENRHLRAEVYE